jgi:hypothetical protein
MSMSTLRSARRPRRHGVLVEPIDRRVLERAGWRTTLDYHENHLRARDGRLLEIQPTWTAEAERYDGEFAVASAAGATIDEAWARLRATIEEDRTTTASRVRLLRP